MNTKNRVERTLLCDKLMKEYDKIYVEAVENPCIRKPQSYALYKLWKKWDAKEKPREVNL